MANCEGKGTTQSLASSCICPVRAARHVNVKFQPCQNGSHTKYRQIKMAVTTISLVLQHRLDMLQVKYVAVKHQLTTNVYVTRQHGILYKQTKFAGICMGGGSNVVGVSHERWPWHKRRWTQGRTCCCAACRTPCSHHKLRHHCRPHHLTVYLSCTSDCEQH